MKTISILFFHANFDVSAYLARPVGEAKMELAKLHGNNYIQFRNIEHSGGDVFGRLCKIKTQRHEKPTLGGVARSGENKPREDVIESSCFRFNKAKRVLICEKKGAVSAAPNGIFMNLLRSIHGNMEEDYAIDVMPGEDVIAHLRQNRNLIRKAKLRLPYHVAVGMYSQDEQLLELGGGIEDESSSELAVEVKFHPGRVTAGILDRIIDAIRAGNISDETSINIEGQSPIVFSDFFRTERISFEESEDEDTNRSNLYDALRRVTI